MKTRTLSVWRDNPPPGPRYYAEVDFERIKDRWEAVEADEPLLWTLDVEVVRIGRYLRGLQLENRYHLEFAWKLGKIERANLREKLGEFTKAHG